MTRARWRSTLPLGATLRESARKLIPLWDALRTERSQTAQLCVRPTPLGRVSFVWWDHYTSRCSHSAITIERGPSSATLGTQPREPARGRSSHIRRIMGGAIKCTVLVPLIPIVVWCRIMVANETEENASETETENPVQASEIRKPECLNSLIRQLVQGIFCDAG